MKHTLPEVLAPAGSPECLTAAVRCGAAAVYLGVEEFNARRAAHNFTIADLKAAVAYCHARDVAVYLTLNTLVRQEELEAAVAVAIEAAACGVDALILQDVGLARRLRAVMPDMPLHASTQLSCHTPAGVAFLRDAGFRRVVLAREMTREEIAACATLGVELEVFVHGALCMSVSGQCYFSAMLGGRSGNRGACAQTCRLPFEPTGDRPRPCPPDRAALSLRDNCLVKYVQDLKELGVASLKIEGRMKRPEYVAAATAVYAAAVRGETVPNEDVERLKKVFSRTGFTDGYYADRRGGDMFGVRRHEDVTAAAPVLKELARLCDKEVPRVPITMSFALEAAGCRLTVSDGIRDVTVTGPGGETAVNRPLDATRVEEQLRKTGGTPFYAEMVACLLEEGLTLPMAAINGLRRDALEKLTVKRQDFTPIRCDNGAALPTLPHHTPGAVRYVARLQRADQWSPALGADAVILPLSAPAQTIRTIAATGVTVGVEIPRGLFGQEQKTAQKLAAARAAGATLALCGNVGALPLAKAADLAAVGGFGLNITNKEALNFYAERGLTAATLSMELTFGQMGRLLPAPLPVGILLYGHQPLMLTRNCPRQCAGGSCRECRGQGITDRTGTAFPVVCDGGCAEVLNSVPLWWGDKMSEVPAVDYYLLHFTVEDAARCAAIVKAYKQGGTPPAAITRGLYKRGVE
ncbi:MAG: U32 family peptidase [Clostridia bacterium]|nr:U32 family peptidase [Clostridia bacterium]